MTTKQLYYLVTIADAASLSRAAQVLKISQPALSRFLSEYEDTLGFLLFLRYKRQLTPTAVGRYVLDCAQKILDEQTRMLQSLRALEDSKRSLIRLATAPDRGAIIYSRIYKPFSRRYPDIALSLTELYASEQIGAVQHGQIDLAIGAGPVSDKVADLPFAYEELLVSLPVSHPLSARDRIRLIELKDTPFVLQGPRHSIRILAEELFKEAGFSPVVTFESNDVILVDHMMHQAVGAGLVSQAHVIPCDELVYLPLDPPVFQTLHIRYPLGHTLTGPERYLAGLLMRERLADPRYRKNPLAEAQAMMADVDLPLSGHPPRAVPTPDTRPAQLPADPDAQGRIPSLMPADPDAQGQKLAWAGAGHPAPSPVSLSTPLLKYIVAIVDEKSLTRAAERFYLSQPALSRYLRNTEDMLCTQLFTRVHNKLQPTNAGKVFANFARNMLQIDKEMMEHIRAYQEGHGGGVYLQCEPSLADQVRCQVIPAFHKLHPDVRLHVIENDLETIKDALLNASADYGLYLSCEEEHPILDCRLIAESELVYCACSGEGLVPPCSGPQGLPLCPIPEKLPLLPGPEKLPPRPMLLSAPGTALRREQDALCDAMFTEPPQILCEGQLSVLKALAELGSGDTILPLQLLGPLARSRCTPFTPGRYLHLVKVHHPGYRLPPSVTDLAHILDDVFGTYFQT